jgi:hypothetical protein
MPALRVVVGNRIQRCAFLFLFFRDDVIHGFSNTLHQRLARLLEIGVKVY